MSERVYNFGAGPAMMPEEVLQEASEGLVDWEGIGIGVTELSHRSEEFKAIAAEAEADLRDLMDVPDDYDVLFLQGGATGQFAAVPLNLAERADSADYVVTGMWGEKAVKEGGKFLTARVAAKPESYTLVPEPADWDLDDNAAYVHITPNETINGVAFSEVPELDGRPLVADMSSSILSEPLDVEKFSVIYASAQKNIGPAGLAVVIVRRELLERAGKSATTPAIWNWQTQAEAGSMTNTPPTLGMHMAGLVFKWLKDQGGVEGIAEINHRKAEKLYAAIDGSELYGNPVAVEHRSIMNVPFVLAKGGLDKVFLQRAGDEGLVNLGGHRSVGGMRASIYNAMPETGVDKLIEFMHAFEEEHA